MIVLCRRNSCVCSRGSWLRDSSWNSVESLWTLSIHQNIRNFRFGFALLASVSRVLQEYPVSLMGVLTNFWRDLTIKLKVAERQSICVLYIFFYIIFCIYLYIWYASNEIISIISIGIENDTFILKMCSVIKRKRDCGFLLLFITSRNVPVDTSVEQGRW